MCDLISTSKKKKKKAQAGNDLSNTFPKFSHARKKPPLKIKAAAGHVRVGWEGQHTVGYTDTTRMISACGWVAA